MLPEVQIQVSFQGLLVLVSAISLVIIAAMAVLDCYLTWGSRKK